ncbi:MAG: signal peptidase [Actinomycetota bacterium]|nr:signal peptidase [Actinomycetota bacterium]
MQQVRVRSTTNWADVDPNGSWDALLAGLETPAPPVAGPAVRRGVWRTLSGIVSTVVGILLGGIALLAVVVAISSHFSPPGQLAIAGHPVMSVLSGSMAPVINTGDLVVDNKLTPAQAAGLQPGQIISFHPTAGSPQIFTHRIVAVEVTPEGSVSYVTKGDANDSRDSDAIASTNIVGLYHSRIPAGGYVLAALHRPMVLGLLIASPLLWLLSGSLFAWAREEEEPTLATSSEGGESPS